MKLINLEESDFDAMNKRYRTNFINCLSGFKSLALAGTINNDGVTNLAPVSSVIHVGANPPLMGMLMRPNTVPRHTLKNILETGMWTLNHVSEDFYQQAHQSSARFDKEVSEFTALGIVEEYHSSKAPYVQKAKIKIGLSLEEKFDIQSNGTHFLVGRVTELILPEDIIADDGFIDLEAAGTLTVSGLDSYHKTNKLERLPYAKVSNL